MGRNRLHPLNSDRRILSRLRGWKWASYKRGAKILPSRLLTAGLFVGFSTQAVMAKLTDEREVKK